MTGILKAIADDEQDLPYLLIGGHAVALHGIPRNTFDLDLMIRERDVEGWIRFFEERSLTPFHRSENFVQFRGDVSTPPVDLMLVTEATFSKLAAASEWKSVGGLEIRVPAAKHLVALKLHAIQQEKRRLKEKDWGDVVALIEGCGLKLDDGDFSSLIDRYGGQDAANEIRKRLSPRS